ncbi:MAG: CRISPR-associated endonuclease Cas2 [Methylobacter sp.]|nr:MAG: CRISPR-associated endonuclease Cas2 [Methylobacter sp.]PPD32302.1 MAG: CRISPR-associated endonuclease Cas2 [Methylomonas sp.]
MSQLYVVCFDITDARRLRKVAECLQNFGTRVQCSVFECHLDATELGSLKQMLAELIDPSCDNLRYYPLCGKDVNGILIDGSGELSINADFHLF